jgi:HEAT repeat protein
MSEVQDLVGQLLGPAAEREPKRWVGPAVGLVFLAAIGLVAVFLLREELLPGRSSIRRLSSSDVRERRIAARELASVRGTGVARALRVLPASLASDRDFLVRVAAARSLGRIGEQIVRRQERPSEVDGALAGLVVGLSDPDPNVREASALSLAIFGKLEEYPPNQLADVLERDLETSVRIAAATAMVLFRSIRDRHISALFHGMNDPELVLRLHCADSLGRTVPPVQSLDLLIGLLEHDRMEIRSRASDLIGRLGSKGLPAVPKLMANLQREKIPEVRSKDPSAAGWDPVWSAAHALVLVTRGGSEEAKSIEALGRLVESGDPDLAVSAASALEMFGAPACSTLAGLIDALDRVLELPAFGERAATLASAVGSLGACDPASAERAISVLIRALSVPNELTRARAAAALARYGPRAESAVPALTGLRDVPSLVVRFEASRALAIIRGEIR